MPEEFQPSTQPVVSQQAASSSTAMQAAGEMHLVLRHLPDEIVGERILLRPFRSGDGQAVWEAVDESRQHITPWLPWGDKHKTPLDSEMFARKSQARWILREDLPMGIWRQSDERFLGGVGLHRIKWDVPLFEIGYWLRESEAGKGYMTEAVTLLCRLCFETLGAQRLEIQTDIRNLRSAAVPQRLGFTHESIMRNYHRDANGHLGDYNMFVLTPADYARLFTPGV